MMRDVRLIRSTLAAWLAMAAATPLHAQYIGNAPPPPLPAAPPPGTIESPAAALARAVRILAASPRDFAGLMAAGRAELVLGDLDSAAGFFGRADEVRPADPAPKVGMGATTVLTGDARGALAWFGQAQGLGASPALLGADRGLAHDLLGELDAAQSDYRAALAGPTPGEARRRLALSLAMAGQMNEGLKMLQPLLAQRDVAANRVRAFVLALGGQQALAIQAIGQAMPGAAERIGPFFALLPRLSLQQKAAAVHLGVFPNPGEMQLAAVAPPRLVPPPAPSGRPPARAAREPRTGPPRAMENRSRVVGSLLRHAEPGDAQAQPQSRTQPQLAMASPPPVVAAARPPTVLPSGAATATPTLKVRFAQDPVSPPPPTDFAPTPAAPARTDRLSGIDRLLEAVQSEPSHAITPPVKPRRDAAAERKAAGKKAADKKAQEDRAAAASIGVAGTFWAQLAGGSNEDRMASEYKRLRAKAGRLLGSRAGYVTAGKDYFRLLVGPFGSADEARAFVNKLDKTGVDSFSWTRSPAQIKIEKLPSK